MELLTPVDHARRLRSRLRDFTLASILALLPLTPIPAFGDSDALRSHYRAMKQAYLEVDDAIGRRYIWRNPDTTTVDMYHCASGRLYGARFYRRAELRLLADLAYDIVAWRESLRSAGYPDRLWRRSLIAYERTMMTGITDHGLDYRGRWAADQRRDWQESTRRSLAEYRLETDPTLPRVVIEGGCGDGEISVATRIEPPNGIVHVIPRWLYLVCKHGRIDPDDVENCPGWAPLADASITYVAGDYLYRSQWPGGVTRTGPLVFRELAEYEVLFTQTGAEVKNLYDQRPPVE